MESNPFILLMLIISVPIMFYAILSLDDEEDWFSEFPSIFESSRKRYGRRGEKYAVKLIEKVLNEEDYLFVNLDITHNGQKTELDNIIVNRYGVFIIEVKSYKGRLHGEEDDYEWKNYKDDGYGNTFFKEVKNPIKQVKRQIHILAKHLEYYGIRVWVDGYVLLLHDNSPIDSEMILTNSSDIDTVIHTFKRKYLNNQTIEAIKKLLSNNELLH